MPISAIRPFPKTGDPHEIDRWFRSLIDQLRTLTTKKIVDKDFNYYDTALEYVTIPGGQTITKISIRVNTPFNAGSTMSIGYDGNETFVLSPADVRLAVAGSYSIDTNLYLSETKDIKIYVSGGVSAGNATASIEYTTF